MDAPKTIYVTAQQSMYIEKETFRPRLIDITFFLPFCGQLCTTTFTSSRDTNNYIRVRDAPSINMCRQNIKCDTISHLYFMFSWEWYVRESFSPSHVPVVVKQREAGSFFFFFFFHFFLFWYCNKTNKSKLFPIYWFTSQRKDTNFTMQTFGSIVVLFLVGLSYINNVNARIGNPRRRKLQLIGFGGTPPLSNFPLQRCQGDCDTDSDCDEGMICFQRNGGGIDVPGCLGGSSETSKTDYCINKDDLTAETLPAPEEVVGPVPGQSIVGTMEVVGNDGHFKNYPLELCQADVSTRMIDKGFFAGFLF